MTKRLIVTTVPALLVAAGLIMSGCDSGKKPASTPNAPTVTDGGGAALPASLFLKSAPAGAKEVGELVASAKPGEAVVLRGTIGGSKDPFVSKRAIVTIADRKLKSCSDMGPDHCKTPWDYCCEPRESLRANIASVQIVDADGKVMKEDLKGQGGLDPLRHIVVEGKVSPESSKDSLVINATGVFVEPKG